MKQVVLKEKETIKFEDVSINKYYGVGFYNGKRGFIISNSIILSVKSLYLFKVYIPAFWGYSCQGLEITLINYIRMLIEGCKCEVYEFNTMTELAQWIEQK